jgi:hypothetical protein
VSVYNHMSIVKDVKVESTQAHPRGSGQCHERLLARAAIDAISSARPCQRDLPRANMTVLLSRTRCFHLVHRYFHKRSSKPRKYREQPGASNLILKQAGGSRHKLTSHAGRLIAMLSCTLCEEEKQPYLIYFDAF